MVAVFLICCVIAGRLPGTLCINETKLSRVLYVNLDHRRDRLKVMERQMAQLQAVPYERIAGSQLSAKEAAALLPTWMADVFPQERLVGTGGCLHSKLAALEVISERLASSREFDDPNRESLVLLLEDDYLIRKPRALRSLLQLHLARAIGSGAMTCRPTLVRLDCWGMAMRDPDAIESARGKDASWRLAQCNASTVVGPCKCGGTHAMLIPSWGVEPLRNLYLRRVDEADCALVHLKQSYCLNAGIIQRHPSYWINDIPKRRV
jgi:hypothetical protein